MLNRWHAEKREVVLHQLGTHPVRGLEPAESSRRLREHGPNVLPEPVPAPPLWLLARQLAAPPALLLLAAAATMALTGGWVACLALASVVAVNAFLGVLPVRGNARAFAGAGRHAAASARVIRGGKPFLVPAPELVPGDLAELAEGDRVPGDMRLVTAHGLSVDESALTGESLPVAKDASASVDEAAALADRPTMVFAGTLVRGGRGTAVVTATGMRTELGRVAQLLEEARAPRPPIELRVEALGRTVTLGCLAIGAILLAVHRLQAHPAAGLPLIAAGLAAAAVPAGLPGVLALALAAGTRRMAAAGLTVRRPAAAATLGEVTVVGTDKTFTLTRNEMTVRELFLEGETVEVTGAGFAPEGSLLRAGAPADPAAWESLGIALRVAALCADARIAKTPGGTWEAAGDPTDAALVALAAKGGVWREELASAHPPLLEFPNSAERRRRTVVLAGRHGRALALTVGAADVVLAHCLHQRTAAGVRPLGPGDRERVLHHAEEMGARALRVLGLAYREDAAGEESARVERAMVWVGLAGMMDPPRPEASAGVEACVAAGAVPVIVTGDRKPAAVAVAREIGVLAPGGEAIGGEELDRVTPEAYAASVERFRVYARATAEHRLRIVRAWRERGHRIAVIGDGLCDAPALREADVGIAGGGGGRDIPGDSADAVVGDDALAAVAAGVREGRRVLANVRKGAAFLLACNVAEVLALSVCAAAGLPPALLPVPILWANLLAAGLPALALALEPREPEFREERTSRDRSGIVRGEGLLPLLVAGAGLAAATLAAFALASRGGRGGLDRAQTQAFAVLSLGAVALGFSFRRRGPLLFGGFLGNAWLFGAAALGVLLLAAAVHVPLFGAVLGTVPLGRGEWLGVLALGLVPVAATEAAKWRIRLRGERGED